MVIDTKFNAGDTAYIIASNKVIEVAVREILIRAEEEAKIKYTISVPGTKDKNYEEDRLYRTKKEAIQEMVRQSGFEISENDLKEIQY